MPIYGTRHAGDGRTHAQGALYVVANQLSTLQQNASHVTSREHCVTTSMLIELHNKNMSVVEKHVPTFSSRITGSTPKKGLIGYSGLTGESSGLGLGLIKIPPVSGNTQ